MTIITSDCIINMDQVQCVYVEDGYLMFDVADGAIRLVDYPENALQQIAQGLAQGQKFLEMDDAKIVMGGINDNQ